MAWQAEVKLQSLDPPPPMCWALFYTEMISKKLLFAGEVENGDSRRENVASNKSEGKV